MGSDDEDSPIGVKIRVLAENDGVKPGIYEIWKISPTGEEYQLKGGGKVPIFKDKLNWTWDTYKDALLNPMCRILTNGSKKISDATPTALFSAQPDSAAKPSKPSPAILAEWQVAFTISDDELKYRIGSEVVLMVAGDWNEAWKGRCFTIVDCDNSRSRWMPATRFPYFRKDTEGIWWKWVVDVPIPLEEISDRVGSEIICLRSNLKINMKQGTAYKVVGVTKDGLKWRTEEGPFFKPAVCGEWWRWRTDESDGKRIPQKERDKHIGQTVRVLKDSQLFAGFRKGFYHTIIGVTPDGLNWQAEGGQIFFKPELRGIWWDWKMKEMPYGRIRTLQDFKGADKLGSPFQKGKTYEIVSFCPVEKCLYTNTGQRFFMDKEGILWDGLDDDGDANDALPDTASADTAAGSRTPSATASEPKLSKMDGSFVTLGDGKCVAERTPIEHQAETHVDAATNGVKEQQEPKRPQEKPTQPGEQQKVWDSPATFQHWGSEPQDSCCKISNDDMARREGQQIRLLVHTKNGPKGSLFTIERRSADWLCWGTDDKYWFHASMEDKKWEWVQDKIPDKDSIGVVGGPVHEQQRYQDQEYHGLQRREEHEYCEQQPRRQLQAQPQPQVQLHPRPEPQPPSSAQARLRSQSQPPTHKSPPPQKSPPPHKPPPPAHKAPPLGTSPTLKELRKSFRAPPTLETSSHTPPPSSHRTPPLTPPPPPPQRQRPPIPSPGPLPVTATPWSPPLQSPTHTPTPSSGPLQLKESLRPLLSPHASSSHTPPHTRPPPSPRPPPHKPSTSEILPRTPVRTPPDTPPATPPRTASRTTRTQPLTQPQPPPQTQPQPSTQTQGQTETERQTQTETPTLPPEAQTQPPPEAQTQPPPQAQKQPPQQTQTQTQAQPQAQPQLQTQTQPQLQTQTQTQTLALARLQSRDDESGAAKTEKADARSTVQLVAVETSTSYPPMATQAMKTLPTEDGGKEKEWTPRSPSKCSHPRALSGSQSPPVGSLGDASIARPWRVDGDMEHNDGRGGAHRDSHDERRDVTGRTNDEPHSADSRRCLCTLTARSGIANTLLHTPYMNKLDDARQLYRRALAARAPYMRLLTMFRAFLDDAKRRDTLRDRISHIDAHWVDFCASVRAVAARRDADNALTVNASVINERDRMMQQFCNAVDSMEEFSVVDNDSRSLRFDDVDRMTDDEDSNIEEYVEDVVQLLRQFHDAHMQCDDRVSALKGALTRYSHAFSFDSAHGDEPFPNIDALAEHVIEVAEAECGAVSKLKLMEPEHVLSAMDRRCTQMKGERTDLYNRLQRARARCEDVRKLSDVRTDVGKLKDIKDTIHDKQKMLKHLEIEKLDAEKDDETDDEHNTGQNTASTKMKTVENDMRALKSAMQYKEKERATLFALLWKARVEVFPELDLPVKKIIFTELANLYAPDRKIELYDDMKPINQRIVRATFAGLECALKKFHDLKLMLAEAKFQHRMRDASVVPIEAIFHCSSSNWSYIQMPFYDKNMSNLKALSTQVADRMAGGVLAAVDHLHRNDVAHGDLKPQNFLMKDGIPRLCDFGLSRKTADQTMASMTQPLGGTPDFMAPELRMGMQKPNKSSDMYSVGKILEWIVIHSIDKCGANHLRCTARKLTVANPADRPTAAGCWGDLARAERCLAPSAWVMKEEGCVAQRFAASPAEVDMCTKMLRTTSHGGSTGCGVFNLANAKVVRVERNENHVIFKAFRQHKERLMHKYRGEGMELPASMVKKEFVLDPSASEVYLFHGTELSNVNNILENGVNEKESNLNAWYGAGVYFTPESCKAFQYCDRPHITANHNPPHKGREYALVICRVLVGKPQITDKILSSRAINGIVREPQHGYDSIVARPGHMNHGGIQKEQYHWETVIFHNAQVYPEYVIWFTVP